MRAGDRLRCKRGALLASLAAAIAFVTASPGVAETSIFGDPFAVLDHGKKGPYEWRVYASPWRVFTKDRSHMLSLPCINVSIESELRPVSEAETFQSCGTVKPFPTVTQVAVGNGKDKVTVAGMAFDREVRMVKIPLSDGRAVRRRPRVMSMRASRKAHVKPFAFLAFAVARGLSIGRIVGYDASGRQITGQVGE